MLCSSRDCWPSDDMHQAAGYLLYSLMESRNLESHLYSVGCRMNIGRIACPPQCSEATSTERSPETSRKSPHRFLHCQASADMEDQRFLHGKMIDPSLPLLTSLHSRLFMSSCHLHTFIDLPKDIRQNDPVAFPQKLGYIFYTLIIHHTVYQLGDFRMISSGWVLKVFTSGIGWRVLLTPSTSLWASQRTTQIGPDQLWLLDDIWGRVNEANLFICIVSTQFHASSYFWSQNSVTESRILVSSAFSSPSYYYYDLFSNQVHYILFRL